jgi:hypothetical protein
MEIKKNAEMWVTSKRAVVSKAAKDLIKLVEDKLNE